MKHANVLKHLFIILTISAFLLLNGMSLAVAQQTGTLKGTVSDADNGNELPYAQVVLVGTTLGSVTDFQGKFTIAKVPPGTYKLQARFIGYKSQIKEVRINAGEITNEDFSLEVSAIAMDEVVVTGTAMETERRAIGNTIATVSMRELGEVPAASLTEVLQGRAPGVVSLPSSGQVGSSAALRIRGMTSVTMGNEPLVYIDGVRVDNFSYANSATAIYDNTGGQGPSRLNDIATSDIDRVEVVKGAAATTLYGTEASNGVIQIFTKTGTRGAPRIHFQHQRGWAREPEIDIGQMKVTQAIYDSLSRSFARQGINMADFPNLKVGADAINSLTRTSPLEAYEFSIRGGSDWARYYTSTRYENEIGSIPSNTYKKFNFRANVDADVTEKLQLEIRTGFVNSQLVRPDNDNSIFGLYGNAILSNIYRARPGMPWGEVFTSLTDAQKLENTQVTQRFTGSLAVKYRPFATWTHKITAGVDVANDENLRYIPWQGGFPNYPDGYKSNHRRTGSRISLDYATSYSLKISQNFMGQILGGFQGFFDTDYQVTGQGEEFPAPGVSTVDAAALTYGYEFRQKVVNAGYFFQGQLGWREKMYLTLGMRADGNSAFGQNFNVEYYPKVGFSYNLSDESFWPLAFWNGLKLRTAYGTSGLQPGAFDAQRTWNAIAAFDGVPAVSPNNLGQPNLKPEKSHELEFGLDAGFFNDRYGLELTYFDQITRDALLLRLYPPSQGFLNLQLDNVGEVKNKGFEMLFRAIPLRTKNFETIFNISVAKVENKVTSLGGTANLPFGLSSIGEVREGYPISSFWGQKVTGVNVSDTGFGTAIVTPDKVFLGQTLPKWTGSFSLNFTLFRHFRLYALSDWATGMVMYNSGKRNMCSSGFNTDARMREIREKLNDANLPVAERHELQREYWYKTNTYAANFVEKADWLKIREVALTYMVPKEIQRKYLAGTAVSLTFAMRNLFTFSDYSGADPETNFNGRASVSRGQDQFTVPMPRRFMFTLNVDM
ncbi:SusC/RagA family TonB-linked outer membrane protein [candidate division KSB1 bacterium]|nr:SusC/RagA family TonB-linked outer membrane protein [candidate division KSB1 bacterium]